jgi:MoxR-like ATPase
MAFPPREDMHSLVKNTDIHRGKFNVKPMLNDDDILRMREYVNHMVANVPRGVFDYAYDLAEAMQLDLPAFHALDLTPSDAALKRKLGFGQMRLSEKALQELDTSNVNELEILEDGISPRALIWLFHSAGAMAFFEGKEEIDYSHIQQVWIPSARHKLIMRPSARALGIKPEHLLTAVLDTVKY